MAIYNDGKSSFKSHITHFETSSQGVPIPQFRWMNLVRDVKYLTFIALEDKNNV